MEEIFEPRPSTSSEDIKLNTTPTTTTTTEKEEEEVTINNKQPPASLAVAASTGTATTTAATVATAVTALASNKTTTITSSDQRDTWMMEKQQPSAAAVGPRKLQILPRITQYERHPLLQERSPSGISQLEELTNLLQRQKSFDLGDGFDEIGEAEVSLPNESACSSTTSSSHIAVAELNNDEGYALMNNTTTKSTKTEDNNNQVVETVKPPPITMDNTRSSNNSNHAKVKRLEPRGAFRETHPLLEKSESGLSEVELYLLEKEQEIITNSTVAVHKNNNPAAPPIVVATNTLRNNTQQAVNNLEYSRRKRLQPRLNQYEKHALLESRDERGLSPLDHFLHEKERLVIDRLCGDGGPIIIDQEEDSTGSKGKCSEKCVCKNASCTICKPNHSGVAATVVLVGNSSSSSTQPQEEAVTMTKKTVTEEDNGLLTGLRKMEDNDCGIVVQDNQLPLIHRREVVEKDEEAAAGQEELIDLRMESSALMEDYYEGDADNSDDIFRSHPPLMKKESSRETMIEPKESNKRVHFERTLSEKERDLRAIWPGGENLGSGGGRLETNANRDATTALTEKQCEGTEKKGGGQKVTNKRRSWLPWGGCRRRDPSPDRSSSSPVCARKNNCPASVPPTELNQRQELSSELSGNNQNQPLIAGGEEEQHTTNGKDMNENNNKKTRKKACIIL